MIRKCVEVCIDRQNVESNVTGCMVIAYWIIKCTDTTGKLIRKCEQFCTDRQTIDCNVTGYMNIAYWII